MKNLTQFLCIALVCFSASFAFAADGGVNPSPTPEPTPKSADDGGGTTPDPVVLPAAGSDKSELQGSLKGDALMEEDSPPTMSPSTTPPPATPVLVSDGPEDETANLSPAKNDFFLDFDRIYYMAGFRVVPGFFYLERPNKNGDSAILASSAQLTASIMQFFTGYFSLSGDLYFGASWLGGGAFTEDPEAGGVAGNLGVDLTGRYFVGGDAEGFFLGLSLGAEWMFTTPGTYTSFRPTFRLGYATSVADHLLMLEAGYSTPLIAGLAGGQLDVASQNEKYAPLPSRLHQFLVSVNIAF